MTEHKFTDEEIKKALECCNGQGNGCSDCPLYDFRCVGGERLIKLFPPIINRYEAEIERLERHTEMYYELRAEAIKEFAERLKKKADHYYLGNIELLAYRVLAKDLDNFVKEMTEGQK